MITATFYATNGNISRGIVLVREGVMLEVAWDDSQIHPASVGWVNPTAQIGRIAVSAETFTPQHKALKLILRGDIKEGREMLLQEERQRQIERGATSH